MAHTAVLTTGDLDAGYVLSPERYDPRRHTAVEGVPLSELASVSRAQTSAAKAVAGVQYLVLDTGDANEGVVLANKTPIAGSELGSSKKVFQPGDVIVSRLRPYLRQVALLDEPLFRSDEASWVVCGSTEFYALRAKDERSIAFLVPFLLSAPTQAVLAAAQEGGHHPRFSQATLESLKVPHEIVDRREELSAIVIEAVGQLREGSSAMRALVGAL